MHHIRRMSIILLVVLACHCLAVDKPSGQPDFSRLGWDKASNPYTLPDWFEGNRVQAHTRLSLNLQKTPELSNAAEGFKAMGAKVFTRHTKTGDEDPWWPRVNVKTFVDDAHSKPISGVEVIVKGKLPAKVFEAVSGKILKVEPATGGYRIRIPEFGQMALLEIT